jgi:hypothetical protein
VKCPFQNGDGAELLIAYGSRELAPEAEAALERHMIACAACRELGAAQREVWAALDYWTPAGVSPDFDRKLYQRIAVQEQGNWWRPSWVAWSWRPLMPTVAACLALVGLFMLRSPDAQTALDRHATAPKSQIEQVERTLDDMDLLKQIGVEAPAETPDVREKL